MWGEDIHSVPGRVGVTATRLFHVTTPSQQLFYVFDVKSLRVHAPGHLAQTAVCSMPLVIWLLIATCVFQKTLWSALRDARGGCTGGSVGFMRYTPFENCKNLALNVLAYGFDHTMTLFCVSASGSCG